MRSVCLRRRAAYLALVALFASPLRAQVAAAPAVAPPPVQAAEPPLDPASPLDPMSDLGVDWPDLSTAEPGDPGPQTASTSAAGEQRYRVVLSGVEGIAEGRLGPRFRQLSTLVAGEGKPANTAQIDRRAREDEDVLRDLLRSYGYYDAEVDARVEPDPATGRLRVTLAAAPGTLYRFETVATPGIAGAGGKAQALNDAFPVAPGQSVDAEKVTAAEGQLRAEVGRQGFAFGEVGTPEVTIDHETHTATLAIDVKPGAARTFGPIVVEGRQLFSARHLGRIARFRPGRPYDARLIEDYRRAIIQTGLVSSVKITPEPGPDDSVIVATRLEAAPPRTIAGELGYGTGEGARAAVSWTHRNFVAPEGALTLAGVLGTREQSASVTLRRNNYKARDRVLTAQVSAAHVNLDAYEARTATIGLTLERQSNIIWQKRWTWSLGTQFLASDERDTIGPLATPRRRTYLIAALPGSLNFDSTDDLLNPTRGIRLGGHLSPELSFHDSTFPYARVQIDASAYQPIGARVVLAARTRLGTIVGAARDDIAPSRRFYAGGGGSVRGYGYQDIGPKDANDDPIGGRSLTEFAFEARVRFGAFGIVPFVDAGNIYTSPLPGFGGLRVGAGIGARYYTNFGPIRVDLGTPIARKPGEPRLGIYVSLGQAF